MKSRSRRYAILALLLYVSFMAVNVPASWVGWGIGQLTGGVVVASQVSGTVWVGEADLTSSDRHFLGRLRWTTNPLFLLTGRWAVDAHIRGPELDLGGRLHAGWDGIRIRETSATCSPSLLSAFYSPLALLEPRGKIVISIPDFLVKTASVEGNATVLLQGAALGLSNVQPLGDYRLQIAGASRIVTLTLGTSGGVLNVDGTGEWRPFDRGRLRFSGAMKSVDRQQELQPLLMLVGKENGPNARSFNIQTTLN